MGARALAHRMVVDRTEILARSVAHRPLRVVDRAGHLTDEGEGAVVGRHVGVRLVRPFELFQTEDPFEVDDVGIGALYTVWLESMQV